MGQVAATRDEPTPAEAETPEVPIRPEVEQYFELPDADIGGDVLQWWPRHEVSPEWQDNTSGFR